MEPGDSIDPADCINEHVEYLYNDSLTYTQMYIKSLRNYIYYLFCRKLKI